MKVFKSTALALAAMTALTLGACSNDDKGNGGDTSAKATSSSSSPVTPAMPTAADLNEILAVATDPAAPVDAKIATVQGSETAPELFETMTQAKTESGANFQVVDPVLPGYTPDSVLAKVSFSVPENPAQTADNVEFINVDGKWQLSQNWACILITNTVKPEQVPPMCADVKAEETPAPAPAAG